MQFNVCIIRQNRIKMAEACNRLFDLVSEDDISELIKEIQIKIQQDACRGVHSACRREVNRHKLDICVLRLKQGRIQAFSYVGQNFLVLKWGGGLD